MTPKEFISYLAKANPGTIDHIPPAPIKIGMGDINAAKLILWLYAEFPDATQGDFDDMLDAAKWWTTLFGSMFSAIPTDAGSK